MSSELGKWECELLEWVWQGDLFASVGRSDERGTSLSKAAAVSSSSSSSGTVAAAAAAAVTEQQLSGANGRVKTM